MSALKNLHPSGPSYKYDVKHSSPESIHLNAPEAGEQLTLIETVFYLPIEHT